MAGPSGIKLGSITSEPLPLLIEPEGAPPCTDSFLEMLTADRNHFRELIRENSGILFRGFPIDGAEEFNRVLKALGINNTVDYIGGGSPRRKVKGKIYTSTEAPSDVKIPLHNELSYIDQYPKFISFYCHLASKTGGATILGDARKVYQEVDPAIRDKWEARGLKYVSRYWDDSLVMKAMYVIQPGHKSWRQVFETDDREKVEALCRARNFGCRWLGRGWVEIDHRRPATISHPDTGEMIWFNQAHLYDLSPRLIGPWRHAGTKLFYGANSRPSDIYFDDGEPVPREELYHVLDVLDKCTLSFPWQNGDVLVLDNVLAMHGRSPFTGPRRILAALTQ
jgi:alpha-ketoglutarate-dependent taurine dioxygenase